MRLLLIEDDKQLGKAIFEGLREEYVTDWFRSAEEGEDAVAGAKYDLIILDINLPGMSGLEWLKKLRKSKDGTMIMILTARDTFSQRIEGLDAGADDYIVKPFDFEALLAHIRALLRRRGELKDQIINYGNIEVNLTGKTVIKDKKPVALSHKQFLILSILLENMGRYVSKDQITEKIYSWNDEFESNTIEVHIGAIRRKLGKDMIKTMRGNGYIIDKI